MNEMIMVCHSLNNNTRTSLVICLLGKSAIATAGEFELMFTNTEVHKIVRISKTNQDNPNL